MIHLIFEMLLGHNESLTVTFFVLERTEFFCFFLWRALWLKKNVWQTAVDVEY